MEATIKFANGQELTVEKNGGSFITATKPDFPSNLKNITIESEDGIQVIARGEILECASIDDRYWFGINEIPESVIKEASIEQRIADIEDVICTMPLMMKE